MIKVASEELREAVKHADVPKVQNYVAEYRNKCMELWFSNAHDELEDSLRLLEQNFARVDRALGEASDREMVFCYAGMMKGVLQVLRQLLKEEAWDADVEELAALQSAKTDRILLCLYNHSSGMGMRHGELAEAVDLSSSALTNMMKRILSSGAADCTRIGKNAWYTLTKAGRRYCEKKQAWWPGISEEELVELVRAGYRMLSQKQNVEGIPSLSVGESFHTHGNEDIAPGEYRVKMGAISRLGEKYFEFQKAEEEDVDSSLTDEVSPQEDRDIILMQRLLEETQKRNYANAY